MPESLKVKIKLFAAAKDAIGSDSVDVELTQPATIADLKTALTQQYPAIKEMTSRSAFAVDQEFAIDSTLLNEAMEIGLIPPVSGG
ncbi:MAG: MoaD/ThiS family protein [Mariniblastus sp.]